MNGGESVPRLGRDPFNLRAIVRRVRRRERPQAQEFASEAAARTILGEGVTSPTKRLDIDLNDPLLTVLGRLNTAVEIDELELDSAGLSAMRSAGVKLAVPLMSQGELVGVLAVGARRSHQDYSVDDRRLLDALAERAAPAVRIGQLVKEQRAEARNRERIEQELEVARLIQQNLLPKKLPELPGWDVATLYRPARQVGGDFYDVIPLDEGRVGFLIGDVSGKGVPAALVMAAARTLLRATAQRLVGPSAVLARVNDLLHPDMPAGMFVTCLYGVLDPNSGRFCFANAGHDLPYVRTAHGCLEPRARGMPLGLMPGSEYEQADIVLELGSLLLLHSDGVVEAHGPAGEMFGSDRLKKVVAEGRSGSALIDLVMRGLRDHTAPGSEQEDDITMLALTRSATSPSGPPMEDSRQAVEFDLVSLEGNERMAAQRVRTIVAPLGFSERRLKRLETAVAEATMNAIEHGNRFSMDARVTVRVLTGRDEIRVQIIDQGSGPSRADRPLPDITEKLAGRQSPRGWGLFLIQEMTDDAREFSDGTRHTLEMLMRLNEAPPTAGGTGASRPAR